MMFRKSTVISAAMAAIVISLSGAGPIQNSTAAPVKVSAQASCGVSIKSQFVKSNRRYAKVYNSCGSAKRVKFDIPRFPDPGTFTVKAKGYTTVNYISASFPKARGVYIK